MISFIQWLNEAFDTHKIHTNPSKAQVAAQLHHSDNKELRYLHNNKTGDTHVGDASHYTHPDIAHHTGEKDFVRDWEGEVHSYTSDHFHAGFIDHDNIDKIKAHPRGLKGYIQDHHKHGHNMRTWTGDDN